jgi:hypothetical protein
MADIITFTMNWSNVFINDRIKKEKKKPVWSRVCIKSVYQILWSSKIAWINARVKTNAIWIWDNTSSVSTAASNKFYWAPPWTSDQFHPIYILLMFNNKYITLCSYSCCAELSPRKPCLTCGGRNGGQPDRVYTLGCHRLHWIYRHWDPPWNLSFCCHRQEARAAISSFASIIHALYVFPSLTFSVSWEKELILLLWYSSYFLSQNLLQK